MTINRPSENTNTLKLKIVTDVSEFNQIKPLTDELMLESRFRSNAPNSSKQLKLLEKVVSSPKTHVLITAKLGSVPIGFVFCSAGEFFAGGGQVISTIHALYVRKRYRDTLVGGRAALRMVSSIVRWARARNSAELMIHVTSGVDLERTDKFLRRLGFRTIGANYVFELTQRS